MKNILLPIDLSGNESLLLDKAIEIGEKFNSKVWLIHVSSPDPDFVGYDAGPQFIRDNRADKLKSDHQKIQELANDLVQKGVDSEALLIQGATVESILKKIEKLNIDLVIIGHEEHGFFYRALFGSVSKNLIKKSNAPILVVPIV
jgi:nucleotide-binding universal stress UspA family protein